MLTWLGSVKGRGSKRRQVLQVGRGQTAQGLLGRTGSLQWIQDCGVMLSCLCFQRVSHAGQDSRCKETGHKTMNCASLKFWGLADPGQTPPQGSGKCGLARKCLFHMQTANPGTTPPATSFTGLCHPRPLSPQARGQASGDSSRPQATALTLLCPFLLTETTIQARARLPLCPCRSSGLHPMGPLSGCHSSCFYRSVAVNCFLPDSHFCVCRSYMPD